jgi:hypothetical protein
MASAAFVILEVLRAIVWPGAHVRTEQMVFQTKEELAKVWTADLDKNKLTPRPELPAVDFDKETVVTVFAGEKRSGGFVIKIENIARKDKEVVVLYRESTPPAGSMQTRALTYPCDVAVIKKTEGQFKFADAATEEGKAVEAALQGRP